MAVKDLSKNIEGLSKSQKRLGQYILNDSTALLVSTSREMAQAVGVSESTVVRFAQCLGYKGFPELRRALQAEMRPRLRAASRMEETIAELGHDANVITRLVKRDIELLHETVAALSVTEFQKAIEKLWRAKKVFIIGLNASMALACFLQFRLIRVKKDVRWIFVTGGSALLEQLALMDKKDVLVAIGFIDVPRETKTALAHAKKTSASIIGITDLPSSPIAEVADICLFAKLGLHTTVNSLIPAFSLVNALAIALTWTKSAESLKALKNLDILLENHSL
jgi:DNA-binding MurR/RpiR family transcriptional regulator